MLPETWWACCTLSSGLYPGCSSGRHPRKLSTAELQARSPASASCSADRKRVCICAYARVCVLKFEGKENGEKADGKDKQAEWVTQRSGGAAVALVLEPLEHWRVSVCESIRYGWKHWMNVCDWADEICSRKCFECALRISVRDAWLYTSVCSS